MTDPARDRLGEIGARLAQLGREFRDNVVAASQDWSRHVTDEAALDGMAERGKRRAARKASSQGLDGFLLTLDTRSYEAVVDHATDRTLRHTLYEAYVTRASAQGPRKRRFDNTALIQETLALRHEFAQLLGFENYAEFALRDAVLTTSHDVERWLLTGGEQTRARAQAELDEIWRFAKAEGAPRGFATWDLGFYAKRRVRALLGFCEDDLRAHFALPDVLSGLFALSKQLLGVSAKPIEPAGAAPHGVSRQRLLDATGRELGWLEVDPFRPADEVEGAHIAMSSTRGETAIRLTCDLEQPEDGNPVLLTHAEVAALFRCLGRGLFWLLVPRPRADALASEISARYFERFCFDYETLSRFSDLPRELFEQFVRARELQRGLSAAQELELGLFDLRVHRDFVPPERATQLRAHVFDTLSQVRREVCVLRPPFWEQLAHTCCALFVEDRAMQIWAERWAARKAAELFAVVEASGFAPDEAARLRETFWRAGERSALERLEDALGTPDEPV